MTGEKKGQWGGTICKIIGFAWGVIVIGGLFVFVLGSWIGQASHFGEAFLLIAFLIVLFAVGYYKYGRDDDEGRKTYGGKSMIGKKKEVQLAENLGVLYNEICLVSERMRGCNSDFIQGLHENFEDDKQYKNFKTAVLATCLTVLEEEETDVAEYIRDLDQEIEKLGKIVRGAIEEFDDGRDLWMAMRRKAGDERFAEVSEAFWAEHFLTAQRFVLGAWRAKQKGDRLYMYKGPE